MGGYGGYGGAVGGLVGLEQPGWQGLGLVRGPTHKDRLRWESQRGKDGGGMVWLGRDRAHDCGSLSLHRENRGAQHEGLGEGRTGYYCLSKKQKAS